MKNSTYLIILLALGLVAVTYKLVDNQDRTIAESAANAAVENIMSRTSVRAYTGRAVSEATLDTLLRAAMAAPTAGNKQPWRFVVIDDRATLDSIAGRFGSMAMARTAPLAVVMCGDTTATFSGEGRDYWVQDVSAATENFLLAANATGLGAVWCGIYPVREKVEWFSRTLRLPTEIVPMACVCVGYPDGATSPKDKWHPEFIRRNIW